MKGLRKRRKAAGISQAELARRVGVSPQAVFKWEKGLSWPSAFYIPVIAEALDCSIAELYQEPENAGSDINHNSQQEGTP